MERIGRHFFSFLLIEAFCYAGMGFFAQGENFLSALLAFPLSYIPLLLAFALLDYLFRYFQWHVYLKALGTRLGPWKTFQVFMTGLVMTITPGKAGEALVREPFCSVC